jgi:type II secretion system protein H
VRRVRGAPVRRVRVLAGARSGFTLIEMLMAVALISVVAVAASPAFVRLMRDRRVNRQAMWIVNYLRTARLRAIGRGLPVVVQVNTAGTTCAFTQNAAGAVGTIRMLEASMGTLTVAKPTCNTQNWSNGNILENTATAATTLGLTYETPGFCTSTNDGNYGVTFWDENAIQHAFGEICYSSSGLAYSRYDSQAVAFNKLFGVPSFQVANINYYGSTTAAGTFRLVFVPPNGPARMQL